MKASHFTEAGQFLVSGLGRWRERCGGLGSSCLVLSLADSLEKAEGGSKVCCSQWSAEGLRGSSKCVPFHHPLPREWPLVLFLRHLPTRHPHLHFHTKAGEGRARRPGALPHPQLLHSTAETHCSKYVTRHKACPDARVLTVLWAAVP